jgi:hypothetical protein
LSIIATAGEKPCLEHRVSVGLVGSTVDPKIESLNRRLQRLSQGGSLVPEGTESVPKDDNAGDCVSQIGD